MSDIAKQTQPNADPAANKPINVMHLSDRQLMKIEEEVAAQVQEFTRRLQIIRTEKARRIKEGEADEDKAKASTTV